MGFLPEALCNYLLRLGWGHGDAEILVRERGDPRCSTSTASAAAPSRMDYAKLTHLNGVYLRAADDDRLTREVLERLAAPAGPGARQRRRAPYPRADAAPEGTGENPGGTGRFCGVPGAAAAAADGPEGGGAADRRRTG